MLSFCEKMFVLFPASDYMRQGQEAPEKQHERYVYDPTAGVILLRRDVKLGTPCRKQSLLFSCCFPLADCSHSSICMAVCCIPLTCYGVKQ